MPMKNRRARFRWAVVFLLAAGVGPTVWAAGGREQITMPSRKAFQLQLTFRDLWLSHIIWVRSAVQEERDADIEAARVSEARVLQNARDIADAFAPFCGADLSDKLFGLLAGHDKALKDYGESTFKKDTGGQSAAAAALSGNAKEVAALLSSSNPGWHRDALEKLFQAWAEQQEKQITGFFGADFVAEADLWTTMKDDTYFLADTLALGLVQQFPARF